MLLLVLLSFFFHPPPTTEIYSLSLHDTLPISPFGVPSEPEVNRIAAQSSGCRGSSGFLYSRRPCSLSRSEEHTSELQSLRHLVCRLLLEKKKKEKMEEEMTTTHTRV